MAGIMLSSDEINAAPPTVRRWLQKHLARLADSWITPEHSARNLPPLKEISPGEEPCAGGGITLTDNSETGPTIEISRATTNVAFRKLIAKRAYELWEEQGRPYGCDMIHWRDAEREIMNSMAENGASAAISPTVPE